MKRTVDDLSGGVFEIEAAQPIPATACRICRAVVTDRTICRDCLYGPDEDTEAETEVFETIWGPIPGGQNDTMPDDRQLSRSSGRI